MRTRWLVLALAAVLIGALGGAMLTAKPTGAVSKDMIQLQEQVTQLLQGQRDLRSAIDTNNATLRTLVQQSLDATNQLNSQMGVLQKSVQEATANSGSRIDTMSTQTQGLSDNMQDVQALSLIHIFNHNCRGTFCRHPRGHRIQLLRRGHSRPGQPHG